VTAAVLAVALVRRQTTAEARRGALFLLAFFGPFFAVWWLLFSYDPRFLLAVFPFIAVMGARFTLSVMAWVRPWLSGLASPVRGPAARLLRTAVLMGLALPAASKRRCRS
jgi:hypothetical protein